MKHAAPVMRAQGGSIINLGSVAGHRFGYSASVIYGVAKAALATLQAVPRADLTDDIAAAALYLASDEAGFVNGEGMVIDGGLIRGWRFSEVMAGGHAWKQLLD